MRTENDWVGLIYYGSNAYYIYHLKVNITIQCIELWSNPCQSDSYKTFLNTTLYNIYPFYSCFDCFWSYQLILWLFIIHSLFFVCVSRSSKIAEAQYLQRSEERQAGELIDRTIKPAAEDFNLWGFVFKLEKVNILWLLLVRRGGLWAGFLFSSIPDTDLVLIAAMPQCDTIIRCTMLCML